MTDKKIAETQKTHCKITESIPNSDTKEALDEIKHMKANPSEYKEYDDADKMIGELLK